MRHFVSLLMIILFTFWSPIHDAQAKRFGGGRSFGVSRNTSSFSRQSYQNTQSPGLQAIAKRSFASKWLGPLAGLVAGGLLATLFMQHGFGTGLLTWLGIGLAVLFLVNLLRRYMQPTVQPAYRGYARQRYQEEEAPRDQAFQSANQHSFLQTSSMQNNPVDFDSDAFLRDAKVQFIRLQSAYDHKNINDIREFTTPEVFAEIQLQLHERGDTNNQTVVVHLDAELLDVSTDAAFMQRANQQRTTASVRFTGKIREELNDEVLLNEIWHFVKDTTKSCWMVAGVQQH